MYSQYDFIGFLINTLSVIRGNWWKVVILGITFIAGIIKIFEWIIELL